MMVDMYEEYSDELEYECSVLERALDAADSKIEELQDELGREQMRCEQLQDSLKDNAAEAEASWQRQTDVLQVEKRMLVAEVADWQSRYERLYEQWKADEARIRQLEEALSKATETLWVMLSGALEHKNEDSSS